MLESERIPFEKQKGFRNPYCVFDFYIEPKICIFVDGDYFHANPNPHVKQGRKHPGFKPDDHIIGKKDAKFMWAKDEKVNKTLEESGYIVLRFYASDIEKNPKKHLQKILKTIKKS